MKKIIVFVTLSTFVLSTGCASVFGTNRQKVNFKTEDDAAEVYMGDSLIGTGASTEFKLKKELHSIQFVVKKEGYEPEYYSAFTSKRSPLYIFSWIGVLFFVPAFDNGVKAFRYDLKTKVFTPSKSEIKTKTEDEKYMIVNKVAFNVMKDSLSQYTQSINSYKKAGYMVSEKRRATTEIFGTANNTEDINISNTIFTDILNDQLKERFYVDTLNKVLKNKTNTLYIDAELNTLDMTKIKAHHLVRNSKFYVGQVGIKWTVRDIYKTELFTFNDKVTTGEFANPFAKKDEEDIFFNDAFNKSLSNLLETPDYIEVSKVLTKAKEFEALEIAHPKKVVKDNIGQALDATVTVKSKDGHGSGFFINNNGYILTNHHVISGKKEEDITVIMNNGEEYKAKVIRSNDFDDVALISIDVKNEFSFDINTSKEGEIGDEIYAIGTPNAVELGQSLSKGIISGKRKNDNNQEYYQTDASVNGGNSGGAFVSKSGEILGIVNAKLVGIGVEGVGFAIKIERVVKALNLKFD
ncbi:MAG TPA: trypsin-like peptidase domain-containing protein [Brumimicrobium sp.]|nr:trypsin-like peptidase domain-containing protein [Brumimicrobium sp.]